MPHTACLYVECTQRDTYTYVLRTLYVGICTMYVPTYIRHTYNIGTHRTHTNTIPILLHLYCIHFPPPLPPPHPTPSHSFYSPSIFLSFCPSLLYSYIRIILYDYEYYDDHIDVHSHNPSPRAVRQSFFVTIPSSRSSTFIFRTYCHRL